jgi:hypothetical protein
MQRSHLKPEVHPEKHAHGVLYSLYSRCSQWQTKACQKPLAESQLLAAPIQLNLPAFTTTQHHHSHTWLHMLKQTRQQEPWPPHHHARPSTSA